MNNIPTASTSTASTSTASTSLPLPSTSTSQSHPHPYTYVQELECTTTDDSSISSTGDYEIYEESSNNSNSNPMEPNNSNQFIPSVESSDDSSWSSIESSNVSLACCRGDGKSSSDDSVFVVSGVIVKHGITNVSNNETLENPSELASHNAWTESTPTNEDSNETCKTPNSDEQKMLLFLQIDEMINLIRQEEQDERLLELEKESEHINPSENESQIDEMINLISQEEHDERLLELEKESEYINVTAWMYKPLDPTIR